MNVQKIEISGNIAKARRQFKTLGLELDNDVTKQLLDAIVNSQQILQSDEVALRRTVHSGGSSRPGMMSFMTYDYNYHISIKAASLCLVVLLADKFLTQGFAEKVLKTLGISPKIVNSIEEHNGEKCIVRETAVHNSGIGDKHLFDKFHGQCCNNDLKCCYREDDQCLCKQQDVVDIYEILVERQVFVKKGSKYKLKW